MFLLETQIINIPITDIVPNRFQPRINFDEAGLNELAASIKEHGIIQPIVVRRLGEKYEIIAGERRFKAAKLINLATVPAIIHEMDDDKSAEVAIVENIQRKNLSSIEEAKSYKMLLERGYLTQEELAQKMGLSQSAIANKLRLLTLTDKVQDALMTGKISERHARSLLQISNFEEQNKWLDKTIEERLTVRELDQQIRNLLNPSSEIMENISTIENEDILNIKNIAKEIEVIEEPAIEVVPHQIKVNEKIPNKFFNYLEDEQANMGMIEPELVEETPVTDDVEYFDFAIPVDIEMPKTIKDSSNNINNENSNVENIIDKDITLANNLVDKLIQDLNNCNYQVVLEKDESTNEIKYIIKIVK